MKVIADAIVITVGLRVIQLGCVLIGLVRINAIVCILKQICVSTITPEPHCSCNRLCDG